MLLVVLFIRVVFPPFDFPPSGPPRCGTADAEIKGPPGGSPGLSKIPSFVVATNTALIGMFRGVIRDVKRIDLSHHVLSYVGGDFCWVCFFSFVLFPTFRSFHLYLMRSKSSLKLLRSFGPKGLWFKQKGLRRRKNESQQ